MTEKPQPHEFTSGDPLFQTKLAPDAGRVPMANVQHTHALPHAEQPGDLFIRIEPHPNAQVPPSAAPFCHSFMEAAVSGSAGHGFTTIGHGGGNEHSFTGRAVTVMNLSAFVRAEIKKALGQ